MPNQAQLVILVNEAIQTNSLEPLEQTYFNPSELNSILDLSQERWLGLNSEETGYPENKRDTKHQQFINDTLKPWISKTRDEEEKVRPLVNKAIQTNSLEPLEQTDFNPSELSIMLNLSQKRWRGLNSQESGYPENDRDEKHQQFISEHLQPWISQQQSQQQTSPPVRFTNDKQQAKQDENRVQKIMSSLKP